MICPLCRGDGSKFTATKTNGFEWWPCAPCGGSGVRIQYGPAVYMPARLKAVSSGSEGE